MFWTIYGQLGATAICKLMLYPARSVTDKYPMITYIEHKFRPSETIDAVIRLKGRHNHTPEELKLLREKFNEANGVKVPRAGETFQIPLLGLEDVPVVTDPGGDGQEPADH